MQFNDIWWDYFAADIHFPWGFSSLPSQFLSDVLLYFLACWILKVFPCSSWVSSMRTYVLNKSALPWWYSRSWGENEPSLRCNSTRTTRIFQFSSWSWSLAVPRAAAGVTGGTMAWCYSRESVMWVTVPWHLRKGRTQWQQGISWLSDWQKQMFPYKIQVH